MIRNASAPRRRRSKKNLLLNNSAFSRRARHAPTIKANFQFGPFSLVKRMATPKAAIGTNSTSFRYLLFKMNPYAVLRYLATTVIEHNKRLICTRDGYPHFLPALSGKGQKIPSAFADCKDLHSYDSFNFSLSSLYS